MEMAFGIRYIITMMELFSIWTVHCFIDVSLSYYFWHLFFVPWMLAPKPFLPKKQHEEVHSKLRFYFFSYFYYITF